MTTKNDAAASNLMNRFDLTQRLVRKLKDEAVIGGIGNSNFDLWASGQRPENFYMLGSMGLSIPIAVGVAIAQPKRRVISLEGDGSLLMQLGALSTVASLGLKNLAIIIFDNGVYQITGSQPTATARGVDIVATARGLGLERSVWVRDEDEYEATIDTFLGGQGPVLIAARIDGKAAVAQTPREPVAIRDNFMRGLGTR